MTITKDVSSQMTAAVFVLSLFVIVILLVLMIISTTCAFKLSGNINGSDTVANYIYFGTLLSVFTFTGTFILLINMLLVGNASKGEHDNYMMESSIQDKLDKSIESYGSSILSSKDIKNLGLFYMIMLCILFIALFISVAFFIVGIVGINNSSSSSAYKNSDGSLKSWTSSVKNFLITSIVLGSILLFIYISLIVCSGYFLFKRSINDTDLKLNDTSNLAF